MPWVISGGGVDVACGVVNSLWGVRVHADAPEMGYRDRVASGSCVFFFFQAEDGIRDVAVTGVQTCALDLTPELRKKMSEAAVRLARAGGYVNAGTMEFLVDQRLNFYFLEVNARLQVEHPVTEQVTGLDLVKLQIAIAAGHGLPFAWETITPRGHAMEVRLYAEDPENNFFPSPGKILSRQVPSGPGIRLEEGVYEGWTVPNDYDPLLSKQIGRA